MKLLTKTVYDELVSPNKAGLFKGSFSWGWRVILNPPPTLLLYISRRTYPTAIKLYTIVKQSV